MHTYLRHTTALLPSLGGGGQPEAQASFTILSLGFRAFGFMVLGSNAVCEVFSYTILYYTILYYTILYYDYKPYRRILPFSVLLGVFGLGFWGLCEGIRHQKIKDCRDHPEGQPLPVDGAGTNTHTLRQLEHSLFWAVLLPDRFQWKFEAVQTASFQIVMFVWVCPVLVKASVATT